MSAWSVVTLVLVFIGAVNVLIGYAARDLTQAAGGGLFLGIASLIYWLNGTTAGYRFFRRKLNPNPGAVWHDVQWSFGVPWWFLLGCAMWVACLGLGLIYRANKTAILQEQATLAREITKVKDDELRRKQQEEDRARCMRRASGETFCCPVGQRPREERRQTRGPNGIVTVLVPSCS
jgi:uncharacterized membrane protein YuzA (DUF378 family)